MTLSIPPFRPFELGESEPAQMVVENYKKFSEPEGEFPYLKNCFANLHNLQTKDSEIIITSAQASDALARVTFDRYKDSYQKIIIANYANHALVAAELDNQLWNDQSVFLLNKIMKDGMNFSQALEAGIKITEEDLNTARVVFTPELEMILTLIPFPSFELGGSMPAQMAMESYKKYKKEGICLDLMHCFSHLYNLETQHPEKKIIAAKAADALARVMIGRYNDIYKKHFIAKYANDALVTAGLDNQFWKDEIELLVDEIIEKGMNPLQALETSRAIAKGSEYFNNAGTIVRRNHL